MASLSRGTSFEVEADFLVSLNCNFENISEFIELVAQCLIFKLFRMELLVYEISKGEAPENVLVARFLPDVHGHEDVKLGILLTVLLGGKKPITLPDGSRLRVDLNMMMIGEAGVGKSFMANRSQKVAAAVSKSASASGSGTSASGLIGSLYTDPRTKESTYKEGVCSLCSGGTAFMDEFDKMPKDVIPPMHQTLEQREMIVQNAKVSATVKTEAGVISICIFKLFCKTGSESVKEINIRFSCQLFLMFTHEAPC